MIRLSNSLLLLARLDSALPRPQRDWIDLNELLTVMGDQMRVLADEKQQQVTVMLNPLPKISGDYDHLIRLFMNLLENAVKYTPEDGQICLYADHQPPDVVVRIADNGIGIPKEKLPHLFERFYRVEDHGASGTGLGLAIASSIARDHGGTIQVESTQGSGTVFTVRLSTGNKRR